MMVAPLVGAWIEIVRMMICCQGLALSLLSWERGLKSTAPDNTVTDTPSLLSWERGLKFLQTSRKDVFAKQSLLSWERGLKYATPTKAKQNYSRSSRGSVD